MVIYSESINATGIAGSPAYVNTINGVQPSNNGVQPSISGVQPSMLRSMTAKEWMQQAALRKDPVSLYDAFWQEGEVCCLFADSNLGKSIFAVQIAHEISKNQKVVYFDFELTDKQFQMRYTDSEGNIFPFNENFIRCEIDTNKAYPADFENAIMADIERVALAADAKVLIIDNLTWLCNSSETGDSAGILMQNLVTLKKLHGWSIMVIAHTPKRQPNSPITQNDLAGSKRLFNFFDSVFAIGQSAKDHSLRYIKQIKVRAGEFKYHNDNVVEAEIVKENGFTSFHSIGHGSEQSHLRTPDDNDRMRRANEVQNLREQGLSVREIAKQLNLGTTSVHRIIKNLM